MPNDVCKGICIRYRAIKVFGQLRYGIGQKRCSMCSMFIWWDGMWCPCCHYRLRTSPRSGKARKLMIRVYVK